MRSSVFFSLALFAFLGVDVTLGGVANQRRMKVKRATPTYAKTWAGITTADSYPPAGTTGGGNPLFPNESQLGYAGPTPSAFLRPAARPWCSGVLWLTQLIDVML
jgi:hypothetical protein